MTQPLHIEDIFGCPVRYFRSPVFENEGISDLPWVALIDLAQALSGDVSLVDELLRGLRSDWKEPHTITSMGEIITIAPAFMAEGLIAAMMRPLRGEARSAMKEKRGAYRRGCTSAFKVMTAHMSDMERLAVMLAAER